jgi:putative membrane protein
VSTPYKLPLRLAAVAATASMVALSWAPGASAAEGDVEVTNTETVQVYTDASGTVQTKRVYEQLAFTGTGSVDVSNPIETDGLRNLDQFGGVEVEGDEQIVSMEVDGEERLRSVSNFEGDLPLEVRVTYTLDGEAIDPSDVVGETGELEVLYTVRNITATPQEVTFDDGSGGTVTKTVDVPLPIVGSVTTTLPSTFTEVASNQANMAGDGKGGTKLSFTLTLFPPIGTDTAEFGYTAHIVDGVVPRTDITALPVNPLDVPTFANAADSYQGGADTGIQLADGAATIDENLLKLRDGAGDLLAGLLKLRDGSNELYLGLAGTAVPGARKLADGMGQLDDGVGQLDDGMTKLADGSQQLADGAGTAADGGRQLRDGAGRLSAGLGELDGGVMQLDDGAGQIAQGQKDLRDGLVLLESGVKALPESVAAELQKNDSYQALLAGMQKVVDGIGEPTDVTNPATGQPATLFGGLNAIANGLGQASAGIPESKAGLQCASAILADVTGGANAPGACFAGAPFNGVRPPMADVPVVPTNPMDPASITFGVLQSLSTKLGASVSNLDALSAGLGQMSAAVSTIKGKLVNPNANPICSVGAATADPSDDCGMKQAIAFFKASIPILVDGITRSIQEKLLAGISVPATGCDPDAMTLLCGANALVAGTSDLKDGTAKLAAGSQELGAGGELIYEKLGELAAGLGKLEDGAGQLAAGAGDAKDGTTQLKDGSGQLADGSEQLADGLGDAADGSRQITDGLSQAADGAPKLVDGAQRLSDEGTSKLVEAGEDTAQNYGELYATIEAGAKTADAEKMAYGAPEGAQALMAYSYVIEGESGESSRNMAVGLTGLALLGAGAGAFAFRRGMA